MSVLPPDIEAIAKELDGQINAKIRPLKLTAQQHQTLREYIDARDKKLLGCETAANPTLRYLHHDITFEPESEYCI